jgi:hypothetical protein
VTLDVTVGRRKPLQAVIKLRHAAIPQVDVVQVIGGRSSDECAMHTGEGI